MNEFLYQHGFDKLVFGVYFDEPGTLTWKSIDIAVSHLDRLTKEGLYGKDRGYLKEIGTDQEVLATVFAANEPNYEPFRRLKSVQCNKWYRFAYLISDYNNPLPDSVFFFFQGYLALQWYHNYKHYKPFDTFSKPFNSMSRLISGIRDYRLYLTSCFIKDYTASMGDVSCPAVCPYSGETVEEILSHPHCFLNDTQKTLVRETHQELRFDHLDKPEIPNTSYEIDWPMMGRSFMSVVNETIFYSDFIHLTEKTFRPIVCQRPFMIASTPGSLKFLRRYGFETFGKWIDESYDDEPNHHKRLNKIADEIDRLCLFTTSELHDMYNEMLPVLRHNRDLFFNEFEGKILAELAENFGEWVNAKKGPH